MAPELPSADPLADAFRRQAAKADRSWRVDRQGWTDAQWCDDAERLMNEEDGAVTSLVNGHAMKLIAERKRLSARLATAEVARDEATALLRRAESILGTALGCSSLSSVKREAKAWLAALDAGAAPEEVAP